MVSYMGWILLGYGLAAVLVHFLHGVLLRTKPKDGKKLHYILVTHNHENQMEWYLRALSWYARLRGESVRVTVLDEASQDDTLAIIQRLRDEAGIELTAVCLMTVGAEEIGRQAAGTEEEIKVHVDLRVPQEAAKIPYVHV
ncbi:hypothetical protein DFP94_105105 [Fontibacillus phaseoli]|uniref:Glycosyl transferase family 2 n=1 Tax=Fontibacillus phaseoli TaxID=1416533 RepID=A0A369BC38_9BACL|nr:hypothetical protein [Fontibacillus phaseoli]RCX19089.1 hypothetical protein DFP94_105105 [Fontibacillus phaseoli]